jgi:hypothetical protein
LAGYQLRTSASRFEYLDGEVEERDGVPMREEMPNEVDP